MKQAENPMPRPSTVSLVQLFVMAAALMTGGVYLYVWTQDLTAQDSQAYTTVATALSVPFGAVVALLWRSFYAPIIRAASYLHMRLSPVANRMWDSWVYHLAMLAFLAYTVATAHSWLITSLAGLACVTTVLNLVVIFARR